MRNNREKIEAPAPEKELDKRYEIDHDTGVVLSPQESEEERRARREDPTRRLERK